MTNSHIEIHGLQIEAVIGVYDWEQQIRQPLIIDLTLATDLRPAAASDNLADTLDYAQICSDLKEQISNTPFALIETVAVFIESYLKNTCALTQYKIRVSKPTAIPFARAVCAVIETG